MDFANFGQICKNPQNLIPLKIQNRAREIFFLFLLTEHGLMVIIYLYVLILEGIAFFVKVMF